MRRGESQATERVKSAAGCKPLQETTVQVKDIHIATARARHVVVPFIVLHGKSDKKFAVDVPDPERGETRIGRIRSNTRVSERIDEVETRIVNLHHSVAEVGGIDKVSGAVVSNGEAFVNSAKP